MSSAAAHLALPACRQAASPGRNCRTTTCDDALWLLRTFASAQSTPLGARGPLWGGLPLAQLALHTRPGLLLPWDRDLLSPSGKGGRGSLARDGAVGRVSTAACVGWAGSLPTPGRRTVRGLMGVKAAKGRISQLGWRGGGDKEEVVSRRP